jgi:type 1 fimbria pilin
MTPDITARKCHTSAVIHLIAVVLLLLLVRDVFAGCAPTTFTVTVPGISYTGGADGVKPGIAIGSGWSPTAQISTLFDLSNCVAKGTRSVVFPSATPVAGITYSDGTDTVPVYPTGVPGIGYVVQMKDPAANVPWAYVRPPSTQTFNSGDAYDNLGMFVRLRFVATGRLQSGTHAIPAQTLATALAYNVSSAAPLTGRATIQLAGTATITVNAASCRMTTPVNQSVTLPTIGKTALAAAGSKAGSGATFHIGMNCDANVALNVTMTDASNPSNLTNTLLLATGSTVKGVGVQVFYNGAPTPVSYGPDSSVKGNANQWKIGQSATATSYDIPFTAAYVLTGVVVPGSVLAKATFTFSYQ